jgi:cytochrome bd-type quinol oxidase subunit 1
MELASTEPRGGLSLNLLGTSCPAFTIGLACWLAVVEWRWLKTGKAVYREIYRMWVKIFAVTFGMGVVSGVVLSYQFGTNWSAFSDKIGNIIGPLLGYEVLTAFFLARNQVIFPDSGSFFNEL